MDTLLLVEDTAYVDHEFYEIKCIYCPCGNYIDEIDFSYDDYVDMNCFFLCDKCHGEALICPGSLDDENNSLSKILKEKLDENDCSMKLTHEEAVIYATEKGFILPNILDNIRFYKVYTLHITAIKSMSDMSDDELEKVDDEDFDQIKYHEVDVTNFAELPEHISTDHGGTYLYYQADCPNCKKQYNSCIWGD